MKPNNEWNAKRIKRTYTCALSGQPEAVFPLLCPKLEYDWIEMWECEIIYSNSGVAELGCVFQTHFEADGPAEKPWDTWVVSKFEPSSRIEFVRVNPLRTIHYCITVEENGGGSLITWEQCATSTCPAGDEVLEQLTEQAYEKKMRMLNTMLDHYLKTGTMLPAEEALALAG